MTGSAVSVPVLVDTVRSFFLVRMVRTWVKVNFLLLRHALRLEADAARLTRVCSGVALDDTVLMEKWRFRR